MADAAAARYDAVLVDANLPMWAHHREFEHHARAHRWWADVLSTVPQVAIPWPTILAFVRLSTSPRVLSRPMALADATELVGGWLDRANVTTPVPGDRHRLLFEHSLRSGRASANLVNDAHLAALATEWGLELVSADRDFARFPSLRWSDPSADW